MAAARGARLTARRMLCIRSILLVFLLFVAVANYNSFLNCSFFLIDSTLDT
jgi:hypothetical protein